MGEQRACAGAGEDLTSPRRSGRLALCIAAAAVFALVLAYRFLSLTGFTDDHYVHLAGAQQMLSGEWPTRDFVDPGMPLMFAASAAAQAVFGRGLVTEALLVSTAFAAAAAATFALAWRLTASWMAAVVAAALQVLMYPRSYSYPKILLYVAAAVAIVAYQERPSLRRLVALALLVVIAFLFRHDHGVFIGGAALLGVAIVPSQPVRTRIRSLGLCTALVLALVAPYALYVSMNGGIAAYIATAVMFSRAEAERNPPVLPRFVTTREAAIRGCRAGLVWCGLDANAAAILYYAFYALPLVALLMAQPADAPAVIPLAVLALLVDVSFLRDALRARLADVVAPASVLLAVVATRAWSAQSSRFVAAGARTLTATLCLLLLASAALFGATADRLLETKVADGPRAVAGRVEDQLRALRRPRERTREHSSRLVTGLVPFFGYIDRCLAPDHRLFVPAFAPDVFVYAGRPFAGGNLWIMPGYFEAARFQEDIVNRLEAQVVPLAIVRLPAHEEIGRRFPIIEAYLQRRFSRAADAPLTDGDSVRLLVNRSLGATGIDRETGWPCHQ